MTEAARFGGKYIYFCPRGLTCFVSPILSEYGAEAKITVGPFIMVERQDFIDCELIENACLTGNRWKPPCALWRMYRLPLRTRQSAFHAAFYGRGLSQQRLRRKPSPAKPPFDAIQGHITAYIQTLKQEGDTRDYPFELERRLLQSITRQEREESQRLLNELLGAILFAGGADIELVKARVYELLVLISRTAINSGADPQRTLRLNQEALSGMIHFHSIDSLCLWLSGALSGFMNELFTFSDAKHANVIHRCIQYIGEHYSEPITLRQAAEHVYLTPPYLCRIFKKETGITFNEYLNRIRVNKAKELLANRKLRLTDISLLVGFEDQSYFTKVFKRITGMLPSVWREKKLEEETLLNLS